MTRNPAKQSLQDLKGLGIELIQGDLDDQESLNKACEGITAIYCHGTSADAADADPVEVTRAESLVRACLRNNIAYWVYNSAGGADRDTGLLHIEYKYQVE